MHIKSNALLQAHFENLKQNLSFYSKIDHKVLVSFLYFSEMPLFSMLANHGVLWFKEVVPLLYNLFIISSTLCNTVSPIARPA